MLFGIIVAKYRTTLPQVFQNTPFTAALGFTLFLYVLEEGAFKRQIAYIFLDLADLSPGFRLLGMSILSLSFFAVFVFVYASLVSRYFFRVVYFAIFSVAVLVQYNYWNTIERFMTLYDLTTALNSPLALWLEAAHLSFNWLGLLPIFVYALLLWQVKGTPGHGLFSLAGVFLFVTAVNLSAYHLDFERSPAISLPDFLRTLNTAAWQGLNQTYAREVIAYQADEVPQNNVVLIIDETIRGDHLSLNGYHRQTTPYLDELAAKGYVDNWGTAVAGGTCSVISNVILITGLSDFPADEDRILQNPTIFQYAKAMGYETYYYDGQTKRLWNGTAVGDLKYIDHWINTSSLLLDRDIDLRIADQVHRVTSHSTGNFIVINKSGVHFFYNNVYPPEDTVWSPVPGAKNYENYTLLNNDYDNGIRYNVNNFFRRLIPDPENLNSTVFLYTGDHGETLAENGETWPHCGSTRNEAIVPLLLIGSDRPVDTGYKASHYNIFATLLDLMEFPESERPHEYPISLLVATEADSVDRYYVDAKGGRHNFDSVREEITNLPP